MRGRIHILGASGSGTSTLAKALCDDLNWKHYDTDDYYWHKTNPPYEKVREVEERINLLQPKLNENENWILSGSLCGWGDLFIPLFDVVVYLWIPQDIRMERLRIRESERYDSDIEEGGIMYENYKAFMQWAREYDSGDEKMRSKKLHHKWLSQLPCHVIRIEEDQTLEEKMEIVKGHIKDISS